ncbi:MAG: hypothetical protein KatS3mg051_2305 [Anaerolineae bacterium]|nr:MAG: hypothetical protein KatS3mg051_2213 [Anaerolineae bacterium]GIV82951.1 MAG: hypothetical protein KatS3mg051_2305 [Anaerolineae bacterium]
MPWYLCGHSGAWRLERQVDPQDCVSAILEAPEDIWRLVDRVDPILFPEEAEEILKSLGGEEEHGYHDR